MPSVADLKITARGEVLAAWGDHACRLRPSLAALDAIQTETGLGVIQLLDAQANFSLRLPHLVAIVAHTLNEKRSAAEVAARIEEDGLIYWGRVASDLLARAIYGQSALPKELLADPQNASPAVSPPG